MSEVNMIAGGVGIVIAIVGVVGYVLGFKAGMARAFEAASQAVKEVFAKS